MMPKQLPFAICNEVFQKYSFEDSCREIRHAGFQGIEIAPFTLAENASTLTAQDRNAIRNTIAAHGLTFVGLHWLLVSPEGLHATTPDREVRAKTWTFLRGLIDLCADLTDEQNHGKSVMVLGSPKQRSSVNGATPSEATHILQEELAEAGQHARTRGVQLLLEPLSPTQTDVVTSLSEAVDIVETIGNPAVATMFDVHNAVDETTAHVELLRRYIRLIRHVHVNEMDGQEPGRGDYDFPSLLKVLQQLDYSGWVSVEAFDFTRDAREIAGGGFRCLTSAITSY